MKDKKQWWWIMILMMGLYAYPAAAQPDHLAEARTFALQKEYGKAIALYKKLHAQNPRDETVYREYLQMLIEDKNWKDAISLAEKYLTTQAYNPLALVDLGRVYLLSGKEKKAEEHFEKAIGLMNGDDMLTTKMVTAFSLMNRDDYAIKTYVHASELLRNPFFYSNALARLYGKTGEVDKAVNVLIEAGPRQIAGVDDTKSMLLEIIGNNPKKLQQAQKSILKKINENPSNNFYSELLTWFYTQKDDWEGAMIQIRALDERNKENGQRLIAFARLAKKEKKYDAANAALNAVLEKGKEEAMYPVALAEKLSIGMLKLEENIAFTPEDVAPLEKEFEAYFTDFPHLYASETLLQYALLEAQYAGNTSKAIELLQKAIEQPAATRLFIGKAKLQLGDYFVLQGKVWDASLTYSQVDKAFKEDMLGEEARFRNAKLAYYRGDFEWAQGQLSVLKASTTELIPNDALYLSVLITENIPPDSNLIPLQQFAHADLLLFQNKDKEAVALLDSISQAYPQHPLTDDILMLRASLAIKHRAYNKALEYYQIVYKKHGQDVLGDDAVFKTAELYDNYMKQPSEAKKFYEELILQYPGSTYVQIARMRLSESGQTAPL